MSFTKRLKEEILYSGMVQKEIADKAGIKKRAFDMYVGNQGSIPPADVAVKIAKVLGVTVEYLATGEYNKKTSEKDPRLRKYKSLLDDLDVIPDDIASPLINAIHFVAEQERRKNKSSNVG